jgi:Zn-dependent protease
MDLDPLYLRNGLITFILLLGSVVLHEWAHAMMAHLLGDDTPRAEGRVTLNPLAHIDLIGTIILPLVFIFGLGATGLVYGYGKPVFTNVANFRHKWRDDILVQLAGPAMNLLIALVAVLFGCAVVVANPRFGDLVEEAVLMNVGLAVFNLIPIPPLDGGAVLRRVVGMSEETYLFCSRWSFFLIFAVLRIPLTRSAIEFAIVLTLSPFESIAHAIRPVAAELIFNR